jgi:hypothetical protein
MNPRKPTAEEKRQLIEFLLRDEDSQWYIADEEDIAKEDREEMAAAVAKARIAVFDEYTSGESRYPEEKAMIVVWPSGLESTEAFMWVDNKLMREQINP